MRAATGAFLIRLALVGALLLTWALGIGRYGGPDEPAHVLRAFAAAHGDVLGDSADPLPPGYRVVSVPAPLASGDPACYRHDARTTSECASPARSTSAASSTGRVRAATSAGLTPPLYHLAVGVIVRLIGDPADTAWYRAAAAMLQAAVVALALTRLRRRPPTTALVIASITPATWFLFGVVNPNALEIALAVLAWVGVGRFIETASPTRADAWWISVPIAIAVVIRPIAIVAAIAMVLTAALRGKATGRRWALATPVGISVAFALVWNLIVDVQIDDPRTAVHRSVLASVGDSLGSLHITAREAVDSLGWNEFRAPLPAMLLWAVVWLGLLGWTVVRVPRPDRRSWQSAVVWLTLLVATPVAFEVALAGSVGPIWQGRYSLPMLVALPVLVCLPAAGRAAHALRIEAAIVVVATLVEVATYWTTVRRYAVGSDGSWWLRDSFRSTAWLDPRSWIAVHVVIVAVTVGALVVRDPRKAMSDEGRSDAHVSSRR